MQMTLGPEPDFRMPGDPECMELRLEALTTGRTPEREAARLLSKEMADMLKNGSLYWLCSSSTMARRLGDAAPAVLIVRGPVPMCGPAVAVVGPRRPDGYGTEMAAFFAHALGACGITVISGGAAGIDTIAHTAAIEAGGRTACILGGGFDRPHPPSNANLFDSLGRPGPAIDSCLISEYSPSMPATRHTFPNRNRLVAAMADAVIIVQADFGSGAMITARFAVEMGTPVFAVPSDIHFRGSAATNEMLGRGATAICRPGDLEVVPALSGLGLERHNRRPSHRPHGLSSPWQRTSRTTTGPTGTLSVQAAQTMKAARVIFLETGRAVDPDRIASVTGLEISLIQAGLLELELSGMVERLPGGMIVPTC